MLRRGPSWRLDYSGARRTGWKIRADEGSMEKALCPLNSINLGHNGYRTEQILWNMQNGELDFKQAPEVFMLLIGTNNADDRNFKRVHTAEQIFCRNQGDRGNYQKTSS